MNRDGSFPMTLSDKCEVYVVSTTPSGKNPGCLIAPTDVAPGKENPSSGLSGAENPKKAPVGPEKYTPARDARGSRGCFASRFAEI
jgi:hypothetical protein